VNPVQFASAWNGERTQTVGNAILKRIQEQQSAPRTAGPQQQGGRRTAVFFLAGASQKPKNL
jgi:hypothetical protein